jgi:hypothetical protein
MTRQDRTKALEQQVSRESLPPDMKFITHIPGEILV